MPMEMVEHGMRVVRVQEMELGEGLYEALLPYICVYIFNFLNE